MYRHFWGMKLRPFTQTHEPGRFVPVASAMLALTKLRYAVSSGLGACALCGPAGVGKTELARVILRDYAASGWGTAYLPSFAGGRDELFGMLLHAFDGRMGAALSPLEALAARLQEVAAAGGKCLAVIDETQTLRDAGILDDLRTLLNVEHDGRPALNLLLCGQPEMRGALAGAGRFDSRLSLEVELHPYDTTETETYMLQRLKDAGCARGIFTRKAAEAVAKISGGNPGDINRLCELALIMAFASRQHKIKPEIVSAAARDLHLPEDEYRMRVYDEVWSGSIAGPEDFAAPEEDILAGV